MNERQVITMHWHFAKNSTDWLTMQERLDKYCVKTWQTIQYILTQYKYGIGLLLESTDW